MDAVEPEVWRELEEFVGRDLVLRIGAPAPSLEIEEGAAGGGGRRARESDSVAEPAATAALAAFRARFSWDALLHLADVASRAKDDARLGLVVRALQALLREPAAGHELLRVLLRGLAQRDARVRLLMAKVVAQMVESDDVPLGLREALAGEGELVESLLRLQRNDDEVEAADLAARALAGLAALSPVVAEGVAEGILRHLDEAAATAADPASSVAVRLLTLVILGAKRSPATTRVFLARGLVRRIADLIGGPDPLAQMSLLEAIPDLAAHEAGFLALLHPRAGNLVPRLARLVGVELRLPRFGAHSRDEDVIVDDDGGGAGEGEEGAGGDEDAADGVPEPDAFLSDPALTALCTLVVRGNTLAVEDEVRHALVAACERAFTPHTALDADRSAAVVAPMVAAVVAVGASEPESKVAETDGAADDGAAGGLAVHEAVDDGAESGSTHGTVAPVVSRASAYSSRLRPALDALRQRLLPGLLAHFRALVADDSDEDRLARVYACLADLASADADVLRAVLLNPSLATQWLESCTSGSPALRIAALHSTARVLRAAAVPPHPVIPLGDVLDRVERTHRKRRGEPASASSIPSSASSASSTPSSASSASSYAWLDGALRSDRLWRREVLGPWVAMHAARRHALEPEVGPAEPLALLSKPIEPTFRLADFWTRPWSSTDDRTDARVSPASSSSSSSSSSSTSSATASAAAPSAPRTLGAGERVRVRPEGPPAAPQTLHQTLARVVARVSGTSLAGAALELLRRPIDEQRLAGYDALEALAAQPSGWGFESILTQPGLSEHLFNRATEYTKELMEAKFTVFLAADRAPGLTAITDATTRSALRRFIDEGPFKGPSRSVTVDTL